VCLCAHVCVCLQCVSVCFKCVCVGQVCVVKDLRTSKGLQVLTLKRKDGEVMLTPADETPIQSGDGVVLLGTRP